MPLSNTMSITNRNQLPDNWSARTIQLSHNPCHRFSGDDSVGQESMLDYPPIACDKPPILYPKQPNINSASNTPLRSIRPPWFITSLPPSVPQSPPFPNLIKMTTQGPSHDTDTSKPPGNDAHFWFCVVEATDANGKVGFLACIPAPPVSRRTEADDGWWSSLTTRSSRSWGGIRTGIVRKWCFV